MNTEMDKNMKLTPVPIKFWENTGKGFSNIAHTQDAFYLGPTKNYFLTILVSPELEELIFCPQEGNYIACRILRAVDNFENSLVYTALDACTLDGMDLFDSTVPKYLIKIPQNATEIILSYSFDVLSKENSHQLFQLISGCNETMELEMEKNKFCRAAIDDLYEQQPPITVVKYIEHPEEAKQVPSYYQEYITYKEKYDAVMDSTCWKLTKPLRICMDTLRKKEATSNEEVYHSNFIDSPPDVADEKPWIGVHLHLYYEDLLEEFCGYLNHITQPFDLYISCKPDAEKDRILQEARKIRNVRGIVIRETMNRGRDIAPFYVLFRTELLQYECLLHIHSKKSLYTGQEKAEWRHWALDGVLKNEKMVAEALHYLKNAEPKAGLIYGEMTDTLPLMALHWLRNKPKGHELSARLNLKFDDGMFFYPVGSFFWARTEAIRPLFELNLSYEDFDEEHGQIDATLAHALERIVACLVRQHGFRTYIYDPSGDHFSLEKSYKSFKTYFSYTKENVGDFLLNFELISFDIFDTLITRLVYAPDDIFQLMERLIYIRWHKKVHFLSVRKEAEKIAWEQHGDFCNIHDIYECLPDVSVFTKEESLLLKEWEIQLEYDLCIPRKDALEIFNKLILAGRRVILVSDMYLTKDIIARMLKKCGYEGYEDIWVSCDKGKRKDRDTLWEDFFQIYGKYKTIHIGDNSHSDCQLVGDRMRINMLWLSPREQFRFSDQYEKFQRFIGTSIENSLVLGYMVNQCFYNSPFSLTDKGVAEVNSIDVAAQGIFAPLFLCFCQFLEETCAEENILLFLSREGFFLQKLYKRYCKAFGQKEYSSHYFLTSRRATSVAQIRNYLDAKELLKTNFDGKLSTFFSERFGIEDFFPEQDVHLKLPKEQRSVISALAYMAGPILKRAKKERNAYVSYIKDLLGRNCDWEKVTLVDVGYAGTIQYYLMKILNTPLDGRYLATEYNVKPLALSGTCESLYNFKTSNIFEYTQLFLEAVTAAPHGQLIRFENTENGTQPIFKEESERCWRSAQKLQNSIYEYIDNLGGTLKEVQPRFSKELAETILSEVLRAGIFGEKMKDVFTVYDGYCMDGEWVYDTKETKWILRSGEKHEQH